MGCGALFLFAMVLDCPSADFGRAPEWYPREEAREILSVEAAARVPSVPSLFDLTDAEGELRDRAFALIAPPFSRHYWLKSLAVFGGGAADMPDMSWYRREAYAERLMASPRRSPASRYALLHDDIRNDLLRVPAFYDTAAVVGDLDNKRLQSFTHIRHAPPQDFVEAQRRVIENRAIVSWVGGALRLRVESYRIALERLILAAPDARAVEAERMLMELERVVASFAAARGARVAARPIISK